MPRVQKKMTNKRLIRKKLETNQAWFGVIQASFWGFQNRLEQIRTHMSLARDVVRANFQCLTVHGSPKVRISVEVGVSAVIWQMGGLGA